MSNMNEPVLFAEAQPAHAMPETMKLEWLRVLRQGNFVQVKGALTTGANRFCALGLLQYVLGVSPHCFHWVLSPKNAQYIASMNDSGRSFAEIADWIEANL
jgi:hypothetical protein